MASKGSFYSDTSTVYTDTNPAGPADAPMASPDNNANSSFFKESGQKYAAIDLADSSVADVENNRSLAENAATNATSAMNMAGAFLRQVQQYATDVAAESLSVFSMTSGLAALATSSMKKARSDAEYLVALATARVAAFTASATQAARQARKEAASGAETVRSTLAGYLTQAAQAVRQAKSAAAYAQAEISTQVALAANYARKASLAASNAHNGAVSALSGLVSVATAAQRLARQYADNAFAAYQAALGAAALALSYYKKARLEAIASASSASAALSSASAASTSETNAASSASAAAASAASLTDDQIALKAQVFN